MYKLTNYGFIITRRRQDDSSVSGSPTLCICIHVWKRTYEQVNHLVDGERSRPSRRRPAAGSRAPRAAAARGLIIGLIALSSLGVFQ